MDKFNFKRLVSKDYLLVYSIILHIIQVSVIIFILTKPDGSHTHYDKADESHTHYDYADESHTHSAKNITYKSFEYGGYGSLQSKIKEIDDKADESHTHYDKADESHTHYDKADESHTHSAKNITYKSFEYGGYGSLQSKIKEIDDKADESHTHWDYAPSYHTHY